MEILEGKQCVLPALNARERKIQLVMIKHGMHKERIQDVLEAADRTSVSVKFSTPEEIDQMTHGKTHGGIIALCSRKYPTTTDKLFEVLDKSLTAPFLLLLEGVEDSRNLGFTLRTAEAFGVHGVLLKKHIWDFDMPAVSRSSSGAYERLPMVKVERADKTLIQCKRRGIKLWGSIANAKRTIYDVDWTGPVMLCIGGEKRGLSGAVREQCDGFVKIPMINGSTSLSMSHAAAVLMAEVGRQRR